MSNGKRADLAKGKKHTETGENSAVNSNQPSTKGSKNDGGNTANTTNQAAKGAKTSNVNKVTKK